MAEIEAPTEAAAMAEIWLNDGAEMETLTEVPTEPATELVVPLTEPAAEPAPTEVPTETEVEDLTEPAEEARSPPIILPRQAPATEPAEEAQSPQNRGAISPQNRGAMRRELEDTISARKAVETQMENLRKELELCAQRRDSLANKESELTRKLIPRMPSLDDFFEGKVTATGPEMFDVHDHQGLFGDGDAWSDGDSQADPWEDGLDAIGIAKCRLCGLKVPVDVEAIEKHSKECVHNEHDRGELLGKCHACGKLLPLNTEDIELHLNQCEMRKPTTPLNMPPAPVPVPGASSSQAAQKGKRTSSLWTLLLPKSPGGSGGYSSSSGR